VRAARIAIAVAGEEEVEEPAALSASGASGLGWAGSGRGASGRGAARR
jgi:hypothetical protein